MSHHDTNAQGGTEARITSARVRLLRAPVDSGIAMSFAALPARTMVLVEIETGDGLVGRGESWANFPAWVAEERVATLTRGVFPLIVGEDARRINFLHRLLRHKLEPMGRQWGAPGPIMQAISAVDMALWDLHGRANGQAVAALLGGRIRDRVAVYASSLGPDGVYETALVCRKQGHAAVKVKVGFGTARDESVLSGAREVLGPDVSLYADANQAWDLGDAVAATPLLRRYGVEWIEEPICGNAVNDLNEYYRATGMPVATGENTYGIGAFLELASSPAVHLLQPDLSKVGGLTEALAICHVAEASGTRVAPHLYNGAINFGATLQLAAVVSNVTVVEYDVRENPLRDPLLVDPPRAEGGTLPLPDGPGLGLTLDEAAVSHWQVASYSSS